MCSLAGTAFGILLLGVAPGVRCISRYWEVIFRNVDGLESGADRVHRRYKSRVVSVS